MTWILMLNDMRRAHIEELSPVCRAASRQELMELIERETVPLYTTHDKWHKTFREGGPLEWYNRPEGDIDRALIEFDIEKRVALYRMLVQSDMNRIPHIGITVPGHEMTPPELTP